ncbi:cytidylyltransferase domain-containing protein [Chitinophagaceae bacterium LWZ2-11]
MRVISFIPVRGGSKSIPHKNIKLLNGKPLVFWTIEALQQCKRIDEIIIATDSQEIAEIVLTGGYSKVKIYWRNPENAQDSSTTESVILEYLGKEKHNAEDLFVLAQATSPFTTSHDIDNSLSKFIIDGADSLLSCVRQKRFIWKEGGEPINYDYRKRPRRQEFKGFLVENGAIYISKIGSIIQSKYRISGKISIYEMPGYSYFEIDEPSDWIISEQLMKQIQ